MTGGHGNFDLARLLVVRSSSRQGPAPPEFSVRGQAFPHSLTPSQQREGGPLPRRTQLMNDESRQGPTNPEVGKRIGLSYSGVSRIRSGDRYPSLAVMRKIREAYGWSLADQQSLIPDNGRNMDYAREFERRINEQAPGA